MKKGGKKKGRKGGGERWYKNALSIKMIQKYREESIQFIQLKVA